MIFKISKTEAINLRWLLWVYENDRNEVVCVMGRPGGSCGTESLLADGTLEDFLKRLPDAT